MSGFPATDRIILGGDAIPGVWHLLPGQKEFGWQELAGVGISGATLKLTGDPLVKFSFLAQFFKSTDWDAFQPFRAKYFKKPVPTQGTNATYAIAIQHPELHAVGVDAVVLRKIPWFTNTGKGNWVGTVEFSQYRAPQPVPESPRAKIPSITKKPPVAQTALEQENARKAKELFGSRG
jgi:hypothetical protein